MYKFLLVFIFLFCGLQTCFYAQKMKIAVKTDTITREITTYVSLINIPEGGRARFQQRFFPQAKLVKLPFEHLLWDTANNILTIITPKFPHIDTLTFSFVCRTDTLPDAIFFGESALMYENKAGVVKKINASAKTHIVRQPPIPETEKLAKGMYYIQVSASKSMQKKTDVAKQVHLQKEHLILEEKTDKYYKYFIGHFATKEQANSQLKYYKQYVGDAFVVGY